MPRHPSSDWNQFTDPASEEYSPTTSEIKDELRIVEIIQSELRDIEFQLSNPHQRDEWTGERDKFFATDPEHMWTSLSYLYIDYTDKIIDPVVKQAQEAKIAAVEARVYQQYIPFIDSRVNRFGWEHSPLEKYTPKRKSDSQDIEDQLSQARFQVPYFKLEEEVQSDFLADLDRLEQKLDRYRSEPTLYTFERLEEEVQQKLDQYWFLEHDIHPPIRPLLDGDEGEKRGGFPFEETLYKAHEMKEIAERMFVAENQIRCTARADQLFHYAEHLEAMTDAPRDFVLMDAQLKGVHDQLKHEETPSLSLDEIKEKIFQMKDKLGWRWGERGRHLEELLRRVERIAAGLSDEDQEETDRFSYEIGDLDWAWTILGVNRSATEAEAKRAYRALAKKYHPDINSDKEATEKMQRINEAYELVEKILKSRSKKSPIS